MLGILDGKDRDFWLRIVALLIDFLDVIFHMFSPIDVLFPRTKGAHS